MDRKIITLLIVLFISVGMVWAENDTSDAVEADDDANYIMPVSISENGIEFSDGFIGFSLDGSKLTANDGFIPEPTGNDELQNYIKLAIIECFKQSREDDIGKIVASFCDGSYKNSNDEVITAVLDSSDNIKDSAVVELDDGSKATFDFELLKSSEDKSDCLAYQVSVKAAPQKATLGAADTESQEDVSDNDSAQDAGSDDDAKEAEPSQPDDKDTKEKREPVAGGEAEADDNDTEINETNKTIINKTNTVIVNEKNTTIITKNNVKNDTPQDTILKTAGNPLFILAVVAIILIAVVAYSKYKKG